MVVQIYEVGSPGEAEALVAAGVDHVGVLIGPGEFPRELDPERARAILTAVSGHAKRVALSLSFDPARLAAIVEATAPDILHLGTTPDRLLPREVATLKVRFPGLAVMRTIPVVGPESIGVARSWEGVADYLLLDTHEPGASQIGATGKVHDWTISRRIVETVSIPVILAGGLGPDNVAAAIRIVGPAGVDSKTRTDRATGGKDLERVRRFVEIARKAGGTLPSPAVSPYMRNGPGRAS
jgi:phosphoribosylanthranilate isomerase